MDRQIQIDYGWTDSCMNGQKERAREREREREKCTENTDG